MVSSHQSSLLLQIHGQLPEELTAANLDKSRALAELLSKSYFGHQEGILGELQVMSLRLLIEAHLKCMRDSS